MLKIRVGGRFCSFLRSRLRSLIAKSAYQNCDNAPVNKDDKTSTQLFIIAYILLILLLSLSEVITAYAQPRPAPLEVGDTIPEMTISGVNNFPKPTLTLSRFRGKLLIIDFWATWCTACIAHFPDAEALQKDLGDSVQVLLVTKEPSTKVIPFFSRYNQNHGESFSLPCVTGDTLLNALFPHRFIPHYVWIGPDGVVKAITGSDKVNSATARAVLKQGNASLSIKKDLDPEKPLFLSDALPPGSLIHHSLLVRGKYNGLASGNFYRSSGNVGGVAVTNSSILWLYQTAATFLFREKGELFTQRRMIVRSSPAVSSVAPADLYTYELLVPQDEQARLYQFMLSDLNRYSSFQGSIDTLKTKCYVLRLKDDPERLASKGGPLVNGLYSGDHPRLRNATLVPLLVWLNDNKSLALPVIDGTGDTGKVDLDLHISSNDPMGLGKALRRCGLDLVEEERLLPMLVITDKK